MLALNDTGRTAGGFHMPCIWIDANVFLGFWKLAEGRLQSELLPAITELSEHILITRQVSDEVLRRRLSTFLKSAKFEKVQEPPALPDHLVQTNAANDWNERHKVVMDGLKKLQKDWDEVLTLLSREIATGADRVSKALARIMHEA
jgi:PIN like domain